MRPQLKMNFFIKIFWAFINLIKIRPSKNIRDQIATYPKPIYSILIVTIEYDKFKERSIKVLKYGVSYPCGSKTLKSIADYCKDHKIHHLQLITSDQITKRTGSHFTLGENQLIPNFGTDICALDYASDFLLKYQNVIVVNSSANCNQTYLIKEVIEHITSAQQYEQPLVVGVNANQRYSPGFPVIGRSAPHIISNFFACSSSLMVATMHHAKKSLLYQWLGGYGNKYIAIRLFELLLSQHALALQGDLRWVRKNHIVSYKKSPELWPNNDSRLLRDYDKQQGRSPR